jgi:uncharacterized pyridoxal phosphate-containing UPF0001 family protein
MQLSPIRNIEKVTTNYWRRKNVFTESKIISRDKSGSTKPYFKTTKALFEQIKKLEIPRVDMRYLSMGMSNSYQIAIEEGANMVRIGTRLFGERNF